MRPWTRYWLTSAVAVPAALALIGIAVQGNDIERQISAESNKALAGSGDVVVSGRDVTLVGVPFERIPDAKKAVQALPGVRSVAARDPALGPLTISVDDKQVVITGTTQQDAWRKQFLHVIGEYAHGRALVDHTSTSPGTDFAMTTTAAAALVSVLTLESGANVTVSVTDGRVVLDGVLPDAAHKANTVALLTRLFGQGVVVDKTRSA
ncbi:MAG TPA: BON domain-containing protein [Kutzneria sp.]|nr:BON domain-containing protein [Kutzneria sp.]